MQARLDKKKFAITLKPINMAIIHYIQKHNIATTKQIIDYHKEYAQASIYRAIKELLDSDIIAIEKEEKVHSVVERYFKLNYHISSELNHDPSKDQHQDIVNAVNIWMGTVTSEIHDYLNEWVDTEDEIRLGLARELLCVSDENFVEFYKEFSCLIEKYQNLPTKSDDKVFALSASWVPIKKG